MYIVRVYRDIKNSTIKGAKVADYNTGNYFESSWSYIEKAVREKCLTLENAELSESGRLRIKDMKPGHKIISYNEVPVQEDGLKVQQYCIITGASVNGLNYIADTSDGISRGKEVSLAEIGTELGVIDFDSFEMFNAYTEREKDGRIFVNVYIPKSNTYRKIIGINKSNANINLGSEWKYDILGIDQTGISINNIKHSTEVVEAKIPEGIHYIARFKGNVNKLILPLSLKMIGESCFSGLDDLEEVVFDSGVTIIPPNCFTDSPLLKRVRLSGYEKEICKEAFYESGIHGVFVTNAMVINTRAFAYTEISHLTLCYVRFIEESAFEGCRKLESIKLADGLEYIGHKAFAKCAKLTEVRIPSNCKEIGKEAFAKCRRLMRVYVSVNTKFDDSTFPKDCEVIIY